MDAGENGPDSDKFRVEKMLAEYERAQEIGIHTDTVIYEVTAIIWGGKHASSRVHLGDSLRLGQPEVSQIRRNSGNPNDGIRTVHKHADEEGTNHRVQDL